MKGLKEGTRKKQGPRWRGTIADSQTHREPGEEIGVSEGSTGAQVRVPTCLHIVGHCRFTYRDREGRES